MHSAATITYASVHEKAFHDQMLLHTQEKHKQNNDTFGKFFARNEQTLQTMDMSVGRTPIQLSFYSSVARKEKVSFEKYSGLT